MIHPDIEQVLYTEEQLHSRVREVGEQIAADYAGREPMLISVLRGSYIFMADLLPSASFSGLLTISRTSLCPSG